MQCPVCKEPQLVIAERQGIEIDYCPSCRGVWLDRGELDKIIERSASLAQPQRSAQPYRSDSRDARGYSDSKPSVDPRYDARPQGHYKKPKSWLSEIFD